jgi:hypothetical protein
MQANFLPLRWPRALWLGALLLGALTLPATGQTQVAVQVAPPAATAPLLRFADFFKMPMGKQGAEFTPALLNANGQTVRLTGYMVQQERPVLGHFMLTPRPVHMSEHSDGDADDLPAAWAMVYLDPAQHDFTVPHQRGLLEISGVLSVGRLEETDGRVSWVRLQLQPEATHSMNAPEATDSRHALQHVH